MTGSGVQDPTTVGPYRLVQRLGEGGMGVVHLALDPGGRAVALKLLRAHVAADPEARLRLVREVETLRRVRHARVAEVVDADVAGQVPYLVTRFVPGRTLDQYVRDGGPLPVGQVADLGRGLAAALQAIHAAGVVHRDIKPANVMIVDGQPVLIDFGIAHLTDESRITVTGLVMGTPGYLSPEVIDGHPVSPATDWWGWAATLAFAASGRPPFGPGPMEVVLDRVRRGAADLDGVDPRLGPVLEGALAADPTHRAAPGQLLAGLAAAVPSTPGLGPGRVTAASEPTLRQAPPSAALARDGSTVRQPAPAPTKAYPSPHRPGHPVGPASGSTAGGSAGGGPTPRGYVMPGGYVVPEGYVMPGGYAVPGAPAAGSGAGGWSAPPVPVAGPPVAGPPVPVAGPPAGVPGPAGPQAPDAGAERGAWHPPSRGVGPVRPTGTLLATGLALVAVTAVAPAGALVLAAVLMVVARTVDRTATALWRRRQDAGHRAGDVAVAVVAMPWRLVQAAVSTLFALVLPLLVGASVAFIASAGAADGLGMRTGRIPGTPTSPGALAAAALATLLMAWWGPGSGSLRRGGRAMARSALRYPWSRLALWALLALVVASALIVLRQNPQPVVWHGRWR